ncbi:serine/threonine-protein kinase [Cystobacter fuscus]
MHKKDSQDEACAKRLASDFVDPEEWDEESDFDDSFLRDVVDARRPPRMPLPGEQLGGRDGHRFQIRVPLGGGGMGQVFQAWDEELQRVVALKFLLPREGLTDLALQEARAIARLDHENIIRIFDVSEWVSAPGEPRIPFIVMECLRGESLAGMLKRERPDLRRALEILDAIAAGLSHAHERHIVHRDLKPSNVFISNEGKVKLLDFGLAHLLVSGTSSSPLMPTAGSPAYMAPEQWRGAPQDERTDIWAAGMVLYEMLTGKQPLTATSLQELAGQVTSDAPMPSVRECRPEIPRRVENLLATALAKDPARRFQSAWELREELHELQARLVPDIEPEVSDLSALEPQNRRCRCCSAGSWVSVALARHWMSRTSGSWRWPSSAAVPSCCSAMAAPFPSTWGVGCWPASGAIKCGKTIPNGPFSRGSSWSGSSPRSSARSCPSCPRPWR